MIALLELNEARYWGFQEGFAKGYAEGFRKGFKIGYAKAAIDFAKKLRDYGFDENFIHRYTDLSLEKIREL